MSPCAAPARNSPPRRGRQTHRMQASNSPLPRDNSSSRLAYFSVGFALPKWQSWNMTGKSKRRKARLHPAKAIVSGAFALHNSAGPEGQWTMVSSPAIYATGKYLMISSSLRGG
jgi:hypothetical protein